MGSPQGQPARAFSDTPDIRSGSGGGETCRSEPGISTKCWAVRCDREIHPFPLCRILPPENDSTLFRTITMPTRAVLTRLIFLGCLVASAGSVAPGDALRPHGTP